MRLPRGDLQQRAASKHLSLPHNTPSSGTGIIPHATRPVGQASAVAVRRTPPQAIQRGAAGQGQWCAQDGLLSARIGLRSKAGATGTRAAAAGRVTAASWAGASRARGLTGAGAWPGALPRPPPPAPRHLRGQQSASSHGRAGSWSRCSDLRRPSCAGVVCARGCGAPQGLLRGGLGGCRTAAPLARLASSRRWRRL